MSEERKVIGFWKPQQYAGYTKSGHEVDFDGDFLEVVESVSGYGGYTSRTVVPKALLIALLAEHGLHIVDAKDKAVADEMARIPESTLRAWIKRSFLTVMNLAELELARREGK